MALRSGIILKSYFPQKRKLSILDESLGKIECVPKNFNIAFRLFNGAYIEYVVKKWQFCYKINDIDILYSPLYYSHNDFIFYCHVLEICFNFLPLDLQSEDIFRLIKKLITGFVYPKTELSKRLFLCHLLMKLGIYPELKPFDNFLLNLVANPFNQKIDNSNEKFINLKLSNWLRRCLEVCFELNKLKTINFLRELVDEKN